MPSPSRVVLCSAFVLAASCTWDWDAFQTAGSDAGGMDGAVDAGEIDGGPPRDAADIDSGDTDAGPSTCSGAHPESCSSPTDVCLRPGAPFSGCCEVDHCVAPTVLGFGRHFPDMLNSIDGMIDPMEGAWNSAPRFPLTSVDVSIPGETVSAADWSGEFRVMWNETALFLFIDVVDDTFVVEGRDWFEEDSFEIWVDIDPRDPGPPDAIEDPDELHVARKIGAGSVEFVGTNRWTVFMGVAPDPGANHWTAEVVIQWPAGMAPSERDVIGLEIVVNDFDFSMKTTPERWRWSRCDSGAPEPQGLIELVSSAASGRVCGECAGLCSATGYPCDRASALVCDP